VNVKGNPHVNESTDSEQCNATVEVAECLSLTVVENKIETVFGCVAIIIDRGSVCELESVH
jgi:hypothetical protein